MHIHTLYVCRVAGTPLHSVARWASRLDDLAHAPRLDFSRCLVVSGFELGFWVYG